MFIYCKKCTSRETVPLKTRDPDSRIQNSELKIRIPVIPLLFANDLKKSNKISRPAKNCFKGLR
jgi:hypothetical protein